MLYRIFKYHAHTGCYVIQKDDVDVKGSFPHAAREWAKRHARPQDQELDLLVARFGGQRIHEMKRVCLRRTRPVTPPWVVVAPFEDLADGEDPID